MQTMDTVKVIVSEEGVQGELSYHMLQDVVLIEDECVPVYGVAVFFSGTGGPDLCRVHNVTENLADMADLIEKMARGTVFPISVMDIVEDFIA